MHSPNIEWSHGLNGLNRSTQVISNYKVTIQTANRDTRSANFGILGQMCANENQSQQKNSVSNYANCYKISADTATMTTLGQIAEVESKIQQIQ